MMRRPGLLLLVVLALPGPALGSEAGLSGDEGHPRARFPLAVFAQPLGDAPLAAAARRAVDDWNAVSRDALGIRAFNLIARPDGAQVVLEAAPATSPKLMGETHARSDEGGVIALPVRIVVFEPAARGLTSRETVFYQIVAHELGHALGLGHARDPRSLMCCVAGSVDFADPRARDAYVEARRHPDVRSVEGQLAAHYARFWRRRD